MVQPVSLFDLATQQARWLGVRQAAVSGNVANVNTPGYGAMEVEPFESVLSKSRVALASTNERHLTTGPTEASFALRRTDDGPAFKSTKNTVVLEEELVKAGEVRRQFELNTAIVKSFHRMMMMTTRS
ncbi:MAG: flagellar basal body rod protein FlgB [Rhizobiaceae bacterium]|nr:flagellar basal body rod protein FlgB [Rhizobiaceae bacterium]MCV0407024.1 flagellar basal body rod protein FlgB [Rhizobiaceae bacterium]